QESDLIPEVFFDISNNEDVSWARNDCSKGAECCTVGDAKHYADTEARLRCYAFLCFNKPYQRHAERDHHHCSCRVGDPHAQESCSDHKASDEASWTGSNQ